MNIVDLLIIYNFIGLSIAMIGFIAMIFIMKKLDMQENIKKLSISGYIFFITPIVIGITNIYLFLNTFNIIPLIIGTIIIVIELVLRFYDKKKLSQIEEVKKEKGL